MAPPDAVAINMATTGLQRNNVSSLSVESTDPSAISLNGPDGVPLYDLAAAPVHLVWKHLTVEAKKNKKQLLHGVSGKIANGFYAIMGPSGSGKTTLLNALACRLDANTEARGEVRLNGQKYNNSELKKMAGYVMQDDLLNVHLTVQETLEFTAKLRLPASFTAAERDARVDKVLEQVGLVHARNTLVGSPIKKGISGGERKRLCVAMELLTEPALLFLDEPTSGLDSVTALSLCVLLKRLAASNTCTVVCTIHQPQAKIFRLFDFLLLLKSGNIVYQGAAAKAVDFFQSSGFPCPPFENPADHFLDVITPSVHDSCENLMEKERKLKANYQPPEIDLHQGKEKGMILPREQVPWIRQLYVLMQRSLKEQIRKRNILYVQLLQNIIMAVLIGTVFLQIGDDQKSVTRRQPVLFFCVINQGIFGALATINSFPAERLLSLRERAAGTYYVSAYFLAKITVETVFQLPAPIVFSCVVYWLVGFQYVASKFFIFMAFMVLTSLAATSLALFVSAVGRTTDMSVNILPMLLEICRLMGGFFLAPAFLPSYFSWLDALSYVKYTYVAISLNELHGLELTCTPSQLKPGPNGTRVCPMTKGQQKIDELGLDYLSIADCAGILIAYIFICRFLAYLGIRFIKW